MLKFLHSVRRGGESKLSSNERLRRLFELFWNQTKLTSEFSDSQKTPIGHTGMYVHILSTYCKLFPVYLSFAVFSRIFIRLWPESWIRLLRYEIGRIRIWFIKKRIRKQDMDQCVDLVLHLHLRHFGRHIAGIPILLILILQKH